MSLGPLCRQSTRSKLSLFDLWPFTRPAGKEGDNWDGGLAAGRGRGGGNFGSTVFTITVNLFYFHAFILATCHLGTMQLPHLNYSSTCPLVTWPTARPSSHYHLTLWSLPFFYLATRPHMTLAPGPLFMSSSCHVVSWMSCYNVILPGVTFHLVTPTDWRLCYCGALFDFYVNFWISRDRQLLKAKAKNLTS
jgi:hypothetical protein